MAKNFSVTCEGTTVSMNISRKEARQIVAALKAEGKKAKVVDPGRPSRAKAAADTYPPAVIAEAKAALQSDDWVGFDGEGEPTDDDARQFIEMTHTGIIPTTVEETMPDGGPIRCQPAEAPEQVQIDAEINRALEVEQRRPFSDSATPSTSQSPSVSGFGRMSYDTQIINLPVGGHFSLDGRFGIYLGPVGGDAKVQFDGKNVCWSSATVVKMEQTAPKPTTAVTATVVADASKFKPGKARNLLFGHPATRVVMWLGSKGYKADAAAKLLAHFNVTSTPTSIATFIRSGRVGDRGAVAPLTDEQAAEVAAIIG